VVKIETKKNQNVKSSISKPLTTKLRSRRKRGTHCRIPINQQEKKTNEPFAFLNQIGRKKKKEETTSQRRHKRAPGDTMLKKEEESESGTSQKLFLLLPHLSKCLADTLVLQRRLPAPQVHPQYCSCTARTRNRHSQKPHDSLRKTNRKKS